MAGVIGAFAAPLVAEGVRYVVDQLTGRNKKRKITDYYRSVKKPRSGRGYRVTSDPRGLELMAKSKSRVSVRQRPAKRRSYTTGHGEVAVVSNSNKYSRKRRRSNKAKLNYKLDYFVGVITVAPIGQWSPFNVNYTVSQTDVANIFTDSQYLNLVAGNVASITASKQVFIRNLAYPGYSNAAFGGVNVPYLSDVPIISNKTLVEVTNTSTVTGLFEVWQIMPKVDTSYVELQSFFSTSATLTDQLANYNFEPNAGPGVVAPILQPNMQEMNFDFWRIPVFKKAFSIVDMKSMWISPGEMSLCKFDAVTPNLKALDMLRRMEAYPADLMDGTPQVIHKADCFKGISTIFLIRARGRVTAVDTVPAPGVSVVSYSQCSFATMLRTTITCGMPVGDRLKKDTEMFGYYVNTLPHSGAGFAQTDQMNAEVDEIKPYATLN